MWSWSRSCWLIGSPTDSVFVLRGFVSRAGVQADSSQTLHPLPEWDPKPEAAAGAAQVCSHLQVHLSLLITALVCMKRDAEHAAGVLVTEWWGSGQQVDIQMCHRYLVYTCTDRTLLMCLLSSRSSEHWAELRMRRYVVLCSYKHINIDSSGVHWDDDDAISCFYGNSCFSIRNTWASQMKTKDGTSWRTALGQ